MKITNKDRELAAEIVELLTGAANERDAKCIAIVLAAHRYSEQGRCGERAPTLTGDHPNVYCALPAGHDGWHKGDRDEFGGAPEWSVTRPENIDA